MPLSSRLAAASLGLSLLASPHVAGAAREVPLVEAVKHADAAAVTALAWSPAGDFLAAASDDEALLFDFTTLTQRAPR